MEKIEQIKNMFPGGNTCYGFYSFYHYILPQEKATRIFILKGGPGVGKSTFMKKISQEILKRGYDVEFFHCSSDNNSLDGLLIPAGGIALIDGTTPHVVEPIHPGGVDEIIYLGDFWNEKEIKKNKDNLISTTSEISSNFKRAYRYLGAAKNIYDDNEKIYSLSEDPSKINNEVRNLVEKIFTLEKHSNVGESRHLFASAITPEGLKNHLPSIIGTQKTVIAVKGNHTTGMKKLFSRIVETSIENGYFTECYHCAFNPDVIEHVVIPELSTAVTYSNKYHSISDLSNIIDLSASQNSSVIETYANILSFNQEIFDLLLNKAVKTLAEAKKLHDKLEAYYVPNMDFEKIEELRAKTLKRIIEYLK